ncbi:hypothetical protein PR202_ga13357 [Eleusine coracana subsp. coracana]|uniref:Uncharacterized protein n=1 Tax=Eleusine coracana subsp. coracana TaxID=191504 RepID=A0AAV5CEH8_ELECO|nr:hypothetical protein PR202_ga13357 [Eleusine coracana subsp. coracana]
MASINIPHAAAVLISGLLILVAVVERTEAVCNVAACMRKGHIRCANYPDQQIPGCHCMCAPPDGRRCVVHIPNGMTKRWLDVFGEISGTAEVACAVRCIQGGYITCDNYPGKQLDGCACQCAPRNGKNCVLHLQHGPPFNCTTRAS